MDIKNVFDKKRQVKENELCFLLCCIVHILIILNACTVMNIISLTYKNRVILLNSYSLLYCFSLVQV